MKQCSIVLLVTAILSLLLGCAQTRNDNGHDRADLIDFGSGGMDVRITKRLWAGFWGPEGYIGYKDEHYKAGLRGDGPTFVNPPFQDNPPDIRCIGTIILDREHNKVFVNMRRIISEPGEPERTKPHPANGTYTIESKRIAGPDEHSL